MGIGERIARSALTAHPFSVDPSCPNTRNSDRSSPAQENESPISIHASKAIREAVEAGLRIGVLDSAHRK